MAILYYQLKVCVFRLNATGFEYVSMIFPFSTYRVERGEPDGSFAAQGLG
jgi:hypothetical protein